MDPILAALGSRKQTDRRYADHMYDVALLQAVYGIRLHLQSRYDSCTELGDHFRTDMLSRLRRSGRWPLRCWSSGGQWQRLRGSHARVVLGWNALRPRAVPSGHFLASRSRRTRRDEYPMVIPRSSVPTFLTEMTIFNACVRHDIICLSGGFKGCLPPMA